MNRRFRSCNVNLGAVPEESLKGKVGGPYIFYGSRCPFSRKVTATPFSLLCPETSEIVSEVTPMRPSVFVFQLTGLNNSFNFLHVFARPVLFYAFQIAETVPATRPAGLFRSFAPGTGMSTSSCSTPMS